LRLYNISDGWMDGWMDGVDVDGYGWVAEWVDAQVDE
jgi:hypothetical protein